MAFLAIFFFADDVFFVAVFFATVFFATTGFLMTAVDFLTDFFLAATLLLAVAVLLPLTSLVDFFVVLLADFSDFFVAGFAVLGFGLRGIVIFPASKSFSRPGTAVKFFNGSSLSGPSANATVFWSWETPANFEI
ncbi:MAG: hypothetical protein JKY95_18615, partial [Planctomycetaceae bacterium]|nr:hypothetical protein [Planctomycetaceae bacterium]